MNNPTPTTMNLSIIIPCYNEESRLPESLNKIISFLNTNKLNTEIIIVDDGGSDNTLQVAEKILLNINQTNSEPYISFQLLKLPINKGKGAAIKMGVLNSSGEHILLYDADGATPISELLRIWNKKNNFEIIVGSRAIFEEGIQLKTIWYRKILGRLFNLIVNFLIVPTIKDTQCGFKLLSSDAAKIIFQRMKCNRFAFDVELLYIARKYKMRILEQAVNWTNIDGSKVNVVRDGTKMFLDLLPIWFRHVNLNDKSWPTNGI